MLESLVIYFNIEVSVQTTRHVQKTRWKNYPTLPYPTINQGVRHGCVLSPILFNIFIPDLAKSLSTTDVGFLLEISK